VRFDDESGYKPIIYDRNSPRRKEQLDLDVSYGFRQRENSPLRGRQPSPGRSSPIRRSVERRTPPREIFSKEGSPLRSAYEISNRYKNYNNLSGKNSVIRMLAQGSEKKKDRMQYADPDDHNFNYSKRFVARESYPWPVNNFDLNSMPKVKEGPLSRVSPLNNDEEDELITVFKEIINHERELEDAKIRLVQTGEFNLNDGFHMLDQ
jgi:hypothetical protein